MVVLAIRREPSADPRATRLQHGVVPSRRAHPARQDQLHRLSDTPPGPAAADRRTLRQSESQIQESAGRFVELFAGGVKELLDRDTRASLKLGMYVHVEISRCSKPGVSKHGLHRLEVDAL